MTPLEPGTNGSEPNGTFDVRYIAFLETLTHLRPLLHRYCARMTGSVLDGEDVMQEALFEAYRKLDQLDDPGALRPWLFRIAPTAASTSFARGASAPRPRPSCSPVTPPRRSSPPASAWVARSSASCCICPRRNGPASS
jgi:DNA-directed RNA polymerase specialized sigma24 family protein